MSNKDNTLTKGEGMTYKEALELGYTRGEQKFEQGYVSRKLNPDNAIVKVSARGFSYVSLPCWESTRFCIRQYLIEPKKEV